MPIIYRDQYGKRPRPDGQPGHMEIVPTRQKFFEADGSDVRINRAKIFDKKGKFVRSVLLDQLGVPLLIIYQIQKMTLNTWKAYRDGKGNSLP